MILVYASCPKPRPPHSEREYPAKQGQPDQAVEKCDAGKAIDEIDDSLTLAQALHVPQHERVAEEWILLDQYPGQTSQFLTINDIGLIHATDKRQIIDDSITQGRYQYDPTDHPRQKCPLHKF